MLSLNFLAGSVGIGTDQTYLTTLISLGLSLTVNAIVTALIVFKIIQVYLEIKPSLEDEDLKSGISGGSKFRSIIFVIIESGMALFAVQLFRICITALQATHYRFIIGIHQMLNGITPTIILVRVSMRLSEKSAAEATVGSLRFNQDSTSSANDNDMMIINRGTEEVHDIDIQQRGDIDIEEI